MSDDKSDFIAKLSQIEEQANLASAELAPSLQRSRLQHVAALAKALRGKLEMAGIAIVRVESGAPLGERDKPPP